MRILLIADVHGNWPALRAVAAEKFDVCLCLGDLVDYGLEPSPCIAWVRDHCATLCAAITITASHKTSWFLDARASNI